jgi:hypothetical protein
MTTMARIDKSSGRALADFRETIQSRAKRDARLRKTLLKEAVDCMLAGDVDTGKTVLRDYINATVGLYRAWRGDEQVAQEPDADARPEGNPQARNLFEIVAYLQESEDFRLTTCAAPRMPDAPARGFAEEAHRQSLAISDRSEEE